MSASATQGDHKNESKHSEMGPVRQNPIQRTVRSIHMCEHCTVHNDDVYLREEGGQCVTNQCLSYGHTKIIHFKLDDTPHSAHLCHATLK